VLLAIASAIALAAAATPATRIGDIRPALAAVLGWAVIAIVGPSAAGDPTTPLSGGRETVQLVGLALAGSVATLAALRWRERRAERAGAQLPAREPLLGERIS
jgi:hypothetical protein